MPRVKKEEEKKCVICEESFIAVVSNKRGRAKKTCGKRKCEDVLRLQNTYDKKCVICDKPFVSRRQNAKFCSSKCRKKRHSLECEICGDDFRADRPEIRFCSDACQSKHHETNFKTISCDYCGAGIRRKANHIFANRNNFCDATCCNNWWAYTLFSGKSKYGGEWSTARKKTLEYYQSQCQRCFKSVTLRNCNVHHIVPIQFFNDGQRKFANSLENLIPLCISCHREIHVQNNDWYDKSFGDSKFLKI